MKVCPVVSQLFRFLNIASITQHMFSKSSVMQTQNSVKMAAYILSCGLKPLYGYKSCFGLWE